MKNVTIILIGCMTLVLKVLAMFTLSIGTLILKEYYTHIRMVASTYCTGDGGGIFSVKLWEDK